MTMQRLGDGALRPVEELADELGLHLVLEEPPEEFRGFALDPSFSAHFVNGFVAGLTSRLAEL